MRVSIYKLADGRIDIMVEAAVGHGKPPVVLQDITSEDFEERLVPVLAAQKGRRERGPRGV